MRGSAAFRAAVAPGGVLAGPWVKNELWRRARAVPSLDLRFADDKSLTDAVTGQSLVTFTRASSGTYVGADGLIKTATTNLLLRSEEFNETAWAKTSTTITANSEIAPNGTLTADTLTDTNFAGDAFTRQTVASPVSGGTYTVSVYLKQGNTAATRVSIDYTGATAVNQDATVTWSTSTTSFGALQNVGGGWYRLSFSRTNNTSGNTNVLVTIRASGDPSGVETGFVYAWGAQLEQSSTVGEYIPTTSTINSAPRFDHNPTTGESLGLLVEEQRTNSIRNNTMVGAVAGTPGTIPTNWDIAITGSGITREIVGVGIEDGITYIDIRYFGTGSGSVIPQIRPETTTQIVAAVGQAWTASYYLKVAAGSTAGAFGFSQIWQERDAVGVALNTVTVAIPEPTTAALGTQRNVLTRTLTNAGTARLTNRLQFSFTDGVAIDITLRIGLPQLEQGAFATSVIPTTTATVTRAADVPSIGSSAFSEFYNQSEGTLFAELQTSNSDPNNSRGIAAIDDESNDNRIALFIPNMSFPLTVGSRIVSGGTAANPANTGSITSGSVVKAAIGYLAATNGGATAVNGLAAVTSSPTAAPVNPSNIKIGRIFGVTQLSGSVRRLTYWPTRLPDSTLQAVTQ
jgi:hypothetical protein